MFARKIKLFKLFGFEVSIDASWLFLAFLVAWTLAVGYFPLYVKGLSEGTYWLMAVLGAVGLFLSIIVHEMCHSLVARRYGLPMKGITLFIFGGIAEMSEQPKNAKTEFLMAAAGPACSVLIGLLFLGLHRLGNRADLAPPLLAVLYYLSHINLILAAFNLIPAFPLDGGRIFRAILWSTSGNVKKSTRTASKVGEGFGFVLIGVALLNLFYGDLIGAIWLGLIGLFLRGLSKSSYQQVVVHEALTGETIARFMHADPVSVPTTLTLEELVQDFFYRYHHKMFPVLEGSRLVGCVGLRQLKAVPREDWARRTVGEVAEGCSPENVIRPDADAAEALALMNRTGNSRLMVADGETLAGVLTLKDIFQFLSLKLDLEGEGPLRGPL